MITDKFFNFKKDDIHDYLNSFKYDKHIKENRDYNTPISINEGELDFGKLEIVWQKVIESFSLQGNLFSQDNSHKINLIIAD